MDSSPKSRSRRAEIRKNRPDANRLDWQQLKAAGVPNALAIAAGFFVVACSILLLRKDVIPYRPEQKTNHDIVSRIGFEYQDKGRLADAQRRAVDKEPRVYESDDEEDAWALLKKDLLSLPERVVAPGVEPVADLGRHFDPGALTKLRDAASPEGRDKYVRAVTAYAEGLRNYRNPASNLPLIVVNDADREEEIKLQRKMRIGQELVDPARTYAQRATDVLRPIFQGLAEREFTSTLQTGVVEYTLATLRPTHTLDVSATAQRKNEAAKAVPAEAGLRRVRPNEVLVRQKDKLSEADLQLLRAENAEYLSRVPGAAWKPKLGVACLALIITIVLSAYVAYYQPRVVRNHMRGMAIAALLLSMLLLAGLAGIGNGPIYLFGIAPTILVAMILAIAYDRRFGIGVASMHGLLATVALDQGVAFFVILWVGVLVACFLMDDIRTRSKLIEVGGATALAMIAATAAAGLLAVETPTFILRNCLYAGAAGLAVGFIVLGILPFVERAFKITTSMTLLELADASQTLLRRLQVEAPGTYSHSLQVATLSEAAAEAIGANSLLCRVGSYYHDVGKINKADYFVENQTGGESRHINLTPNVSYLIIAGHVKDGVELAKEYNLPTNLVNFIQQHHGTTLVEYFYHQACTKQQLCEPGGPAPADHQYRYPGPKPRSKEVAIVMIADAVESATRAMVEPTASRVDGLVHELAMKRLLDGQFDECDLTLRDLAAIERTMIKTIMSIYHGRIAYPSTVGTSSTGSTAPNSDSTGSLTTQSARSA